MSVMRSTFTTQLLHRVALYLVLMSAAWIGFYGFTLPADVPHDVRTASAVQVSTDATPGRDLFNPTAALDATQVDDQRRTCPATKERVLWPDGAVKETTPMIPVEATCYVVPEESPDGGHVLPHDQWLDNSPVYDGPEHWVLLVNDTAGTITWQSPESDAAQDAPQVHTVAYVHHRAHSRHHGRRVTEDSARWSCATMGNHVCGPGQHAAPAGCYHNGRLIIPWTRYDVPSADPLYGQLTPPC